MKKPITLLVLSLTYLMIYASTPGPTKPSTNLAGTYQCTIFKRNHSNGHAIVKYILDPHNSNFKQGYSTYSFAGGFLQNGDYIYTGKAIVKGNTMAQQFQSKKDPDDNGVQLVSITYTTDKNGVIVPTLHKFGYQAPYSEGNATVRIDCARTYL